MGMRKPGRGRYPQFQVPDIPEEQWCEARSLLENGMTLSQISQRLHCDPRTIKACILRNSDHLDRKNMPRIMEPYEEFVRQLLSSGEFNSITSFGRISKIIYRLLKEQTDYKGSEKTVRNYLAELPLDELMAYTPTILENSG